MILAAAVAVMLAAPQVKGEAIRNCREEINPEKDTVTALAEVAVVARMKQKNDLRQEPLSATVLLRIWLLLPQIFIFHSTVQR